MDTPTPTSSPSPSPTPEQIAQALQLGYLLIIIGVVFVVPTLILCALHMRDYFKNWTQPRTQTLVLRVVSLVPVWSLLGLVNMLLPAPDGLKYRYIIQIFLDLMESFAIISFMQLIYNYLGGKEQAHWKAENKTPYRMCLCVMAYPGERLMKILHLCIYQFAVTRPLISTINCILVSQGIAQGKGSLIGSPIDLLMTALTFIFLIIAMWGLLQVYRIFRVVLRPYDVGKKFIAIKLYILLHVIQGFLFGFFDHHIPDTASPAITYNFIKIEYLLFIVEMFIGAILNRNIFFNVNEYRDADSFVDESVVRERIRLGNQSSYNKLYDQDILDATAANDPK